MVCDAEPIRIWEDDLWHLGMSIAAPTPGLFSLEPKRRIPHITDLDGDEATTFGGVLAHASRALKEETGAEHVSVAVPGSDAPRLCVHLVPQVSIAEDQLREVAERVRHRLAEPPPPRPEHPQQMPPFIPYPVSTPTPRRDPWQPEIPPPHPEPPDEPWPDRPAHDPWF
ncbi:MAG: HIT family protein [Egibacteraceae bacterium]